MIVNLELKIAHISTVTYVCSMRQKYHRYIYLTVYNCANQHFVEAKLAKRSFLYSFKIIRFKIV